MLTFMIVTIAHQKGGTGKSTLAICIASELAGRGRNVLLVDADPQQTTQTWHDLGVERVEGQRPTSDGQPLEAGGKRPAKLPWPMPSVVSMSGTLHQEHQLPKLASGFDYVIVDTPPRLGPTLKSALVVADLALVPCGATGPDVWALAETLEIIEDAQGFRPELKAALVINRKREGTALGNKARASLSASRLKVLDTEIGLRQAYAEAVGAGQGVTDYEPDSTAAREMRSLVDEVLELLAGDGEVREISSAEAAS